MRRVSRRKQIQEAISKLDAFPKIEPDVQQSSSSGGFTTIVTALIIVFLVSGEFMYYRTVETKYEYKVDTDMRKDMQLTLDLTINMACKYLGADYIDVSGNSSDAAKYLKLEATHFDLAPNQAAWIQKLQNSKRGARGLDSLERFLHSAKRETMPEAIPPHSGEAKACRVHGHMPINKVAANFHITAGKSIHHARGHSHLVGIVPISEMNFTHRFDRLSFSTSEDETHTLDGDTQVTTNAQEMFQYYLKVVPTYTKNLRQSNAFRSFQYSVAEQRRKIDTIGSSQGLPGIYVKYDLEPLSVHITEKQRPIISFFVRLCGIVGGVFATSGMLHQTVSGTLSTFVTKGDASNLPSVSAN